MSKNKLHGLASKIKPLSPWYLLALTIVFGTISVFALRQNNLTMVKLRDQVFAADKAGGDVEGSLRNLRKFVYAHMNTNLSSDTGVHPPIQLKYTYDRLVQAQKDKLGNNSQIYTDAQNYCEQFISHQVFGGAHINCVTDYINSHQLATQQPIPDSLYKFDFVSPTWSPDLAGWSLVLTGLFLVLFIFKYGLDFWLKYELRNST